MKNPGTLPFRDFSCVEVPRIREVRLRTLRPGLLLRRAGAARTGRGGSLRRSVRADAGGQSTVSRMSTSVKVHPKRSLAHSSSNCRICDRSVVSASTALKKAPMVW